MATQTTYTERMAAAVEGMIANSEHNNVISRVAQSAIGFGKVVVQGTADNQVKSAAAGVYDAASTAKAGNTGNGVLTLANPKTGAGVQPGRYTVTIIEPAANGGVFSVSGPGGERPAGTIGVAYSDQVAFTLADGATDFAAGDQFYIDTTVTGAPAFVGISVKEVILPPAQLDAFAVGDIVPVMNRGVIWVTNSAGLTVPVGSPAFFVAASGLITSVNTNIPIPNGYFDSSAANGALVKLRLK